MDQDPPQASTSRASTMVEFHQTPDVHFFLCRQCRTHLALTQEFVFKDIMIDAGILKNVVNVDVAGPAHYRMDRANTVADVNCSGCKRFLGWKFVEVPQENIVVAAGRFLLHLNKLLMWDGKNMLCADTHEPVENA